MKWFKINGREWNVHVFEPKESFSILYSDKTGRTLAEGAMVLDPIGTFFNYSLTVGKKRGFEKEFDALWDYISKPRRESIIVSFPRNQEMWETYNDGEKIEGFYAYVSSGERGIKKIREDVDGNLQFVEYDTFTINFIASKAQVLPDD